MSSVPQMQVYARSYPSPECPLLFPYDISNEPYGNNISSEQDMQCGYGSQPGSPPFYSMPGSPPSSHEFGWSDHRQDYGSPTTQDLMHEPMSPDYDNCTIDSSPYVYLTHPQSTIADPALTFPMSQYDLSGLRLHMELQMESVPMASHYGSSNYSMTSAQERFSPPFQNGAKLFQQGGIDSPSPIMPFFHPPSIATPYSQSPSLSNSSPPMQSPHPMDFRNNTKATKEENLRRLSSSSASSVTIAHNISTVPRRRRQQKDRTSERPYKCEVPGCKFESHGFGRAFNFNKHKETHTNPPRLEKCHYVDVKCPYVEKGFIRKHDLARHIRNVGILFIMDSMWLILRL
jgi:hypothetical protein